MKTEYLLLLILSALVYSAADCELSYDGCPEREVFSDCANCKKTCNVRKVDEDCMCYPGCECKPGYLRNFENICVLETDCGAPCDNDYGKVYDPCGFVQCQTTCENIINKEEVICTKRENCTLEYQGGCRCRGDLVYNQRTDQCVRPEDCTTKCPPGEVYSECLGAPECEGTCDEPKKKWTCLYPFCRAGCICGTESVRDENGVCIDKDSCFISCDGDPNAVSRCSRCGELNKCSQIDDDLGVACVPENNLNSECTPSCLCKSGYKEYNGRCIPIENCPKCDGENEAYLCRKFDLTSENIELGIRDFAYLGRGDSCTEGCYCKLGYARNEFGECVRLNTIQQPPCGGDPNAYFDHCWIFINSEYCRRNGQCRCKEGFVFNSDGKCVLPSNAEQI